MDCHFTNSSLALFNNIVLILIFIFAAKKIIQGKKFKKSLNKLLKPYIFYFIKCTQKVNDYVYFVVF